MKKLVKLDPHTFFFTEIDKVTLKKIAKELKKFVVDDISDESDHYGIRKSVLPICERALRGEIDIPVPWDDLPLRYYLQEGYLPKRFETIYNAFCAVASGLPLRQLEKVEIEGEFYAYMDFVDEAE